MKKFCSVLLAVLLLCTLTVGASAQTTVKFWAHQNLAWNASYEGLIAEFEAANPDITIEFTNYPYADFEAKIQTSLASGSAGADIYEVWGGWMLDFIDTGVLSETPEHLVAELREDAFAPVLGTLEHDGKIYGAPIEFNIEYGGLLVHKGLFEEKGLAYPTTWEEVIQIATEAAVANGEIMELRGLEYAQRDNLMANWLSMILQKGGAYLVDGKVDFTTPEAVEAIQELASYITEGQVTNLDGTTESQGVAGHELLGLDEALMVTRGPWVISDCVESFGMELGANLDYIAQPPFYPGVTQKWVAETGWSLCVQKNSAVADAAWKFIEFMMDPEVLVRHNIACAQIPPRASAASDPDYVAQMPYMEPLLEILGEAEFVGPFNTDVFKEYLVQMFVSIVADGVPAAEACQKFTDDLSANMKIY